MTPQDAKEAAEEFSQLCYCNTPGICHGCEASTKRIFLAGAAWAESRVTAALSAHDKSFLRVSLERDAALARIEELEARVVGAEKTYLVGQKRNIDLRVEVERLVSAGWVLIEAFNSNLGLIPLLHLSRMDGIRSAIEAFGDLISSHKGGSDE